MSKVSCLRKQHNNRDRASQSPAQSIELSKIELNRIQLNMDWVRLISGIKESNTELCVTLISEPIELNRTNQTQSNSIHWIVFDWVWLPYSIKHSPMDCVRLCSVNKFAGTKVMLCGLTARLVTVRKLWWTYIQGKPIENTFSRPFFMIIQ